MGQLDGKQIKDSTVTQNKLNLTTPTGSDPKAAVTVDYLESSSSNTSSSIENKNMTAETTVNVGDLACDTTVTEAPLSGSHMKVLVNGIDINIGGIEYFGATGLELDDVSSVEGTGDYAIKGDALPDSGEGTIYGTTQYVNGNDKRIFITYNSGGLYEYNVYTNTGKYYSYTTTSSTGINAVDGDPLPDENTLNVMYDSYNDYLYVCTQTSVWRYDYATNIGLIVPGSTTTGSNAWRCAWIDVDNDKLYVGGWEIYIRVVDLMDGSYSTLTPANGDPIPSNMWRIQNIYPNSDNTKIAVSGSPTKQVWLYDIATDTGKLLNTTTTGGGGSYEVIGDVIPANAIEKVAWFVNDEDRDIVVCGLWDYGLWLYDEFATTGAGEGTLLDTTTTDGGSHPVNVDPLQHDRIYNLATIDNIIYAGTSAGWWVYDPATNNGKEYSITTTSSGGSYAVNLDALSSDNTKDTFIENVAKIDNKIYFGSATNYLWVSLDGYELTEAAFFKGDTALTIRGIDDVEEGDKLYWNNGKAGFNLGTTDQIDYNYLINLSS